MSKFAQILAVHVTRENGRVKSTTRQEIADRAISSSAERVGMRGVATWRRPPMAGEPDLGGVVDICLNKKEWIALTERLATLERENERLKEALSRRAAHPPSCMVGKDPDDATGPLLRLKCQCELSALLPDGRVPSPKETT